MMSEQKQIIPDGYKQTEIGLIPDDWTVIELKHLIDKDRGIRYGIVQPGIYEPNGRLMVRGQDYSKGWVSEDKIFRVSSRVEERYKNARLRSSDLIITIVGAGTGHVELIPEWLDGASLTQTTARMTLNKLVADPRYCQYSLLMEYAQTLISSYIKGNAQPGLNCMDIYSFKIAIPNTLKEQITISNALSDVDVLISESEKLIAKKQAIKTATMQQLLTGKTRLPQFALREDGTPKGYKISELGEMPEDWEVTILGDKTSFVGSGKTSTKGKGNYPLYGSTGLIGTCLMPEYEGDAILIARVGANAGQLNFVSGKYGVSDNTIIVRLKNGYDIHYFKYWLIQKNLNSMVFGSGQPLITGSQLKTLVFLLPCAEEQTAVANVLSDIDEEIQTLQQRLNKTRQIKQGMMQELLTGKTRLICTVREEQAK